MSTLWVKMFSTCAEIVHSVCVLKAFASLGFTETSFLFLGRTCIQRLNSCVSSVLHIEHAVCLTLNATLLPHKHLAHVDASHVGFQLRPEPPA